jgi:hypothetical protein
MKERITEYFSWPETAKILGVPEKDHLLRCVLDNHHVESVQDETGRWWIHATSVSRFLRLWESQHTQHASTEELLDS